MNKGTHLRILFYLLFLVCDLKAQVITIYNEQNSELPFNTVRCLEIQNNSIWIGTDVGLAKLENEQWEVYTSLNSPLYSDDIRSIKSEGDSVVWIGTVQGGLFSFNGTDWVNYNVSNSGLQDNLVRDINIDLNNNIWLATTEGVFMYDRTDWYHWNIQDNNLLTNNITSIEIGLHNEKYVGTINGGIIYFDSINQFIEYTLINSDLPDNSVVDIELGPSGHPWFISPAAGLVTDNGIGGPWTYYNQMNSGISTSSLNCLKFYGSQIAIGSEVAGLIFKNNDSWEFLNSGNSNLPDDHILSIQVDNNQNIWAGTFNGGLCKIAFENSLSTLKQNSFIIYPNMVSSNGTVHFEHSFSGILRMYNSVGELVFHKKCINQNQFILPINIGAGHYQITLSSGNSKKTQQLIIR